MTTLTRADLVKVFGNNPKAIQAFETLQVKVASGEAAQTTTTATTDALQDATVVVLSSNNAFTNERILAVGSGLSIEDNGGQVVLHLANPIAVLGSGTLRFAIEADTTVSLPQSGTLLTDDIPGPFLDDPAAAAAGIEVGKIYRKTGGTVAWRVT